jgi:hypothetical protein
MRKRKAVSNALMHAHTRQGTKDHDVSQNRDALLRHLPSDGGTYLCVYTRTRTRTSTHLASHTSTRRCSDSHVVELVYVRVHVYVCMCMYLCMYASLYASYMHTRVGADGKSRVLDLGCGPGRDVKFFHDLGLDVTGLGENKCIWNMEYDMYS